MFITSLSFGQSVITGTVIDGDFNEPLPFKTLYYVIKDLLKGFRELSLILEGKYFFEVSDPGPYEIEFSYLGYETKVVGD